MSGTQEFLFGLIFNGVMTAVIVAIAVVLGRKESRRKTISEVEDWIKETRRAS